MLIRDILFDKPRIAYERKIATDNIKALQAEIKRAVSRREEYDEEEASESTAPAEGEAGQNILQACRSSDMNGTSLIDEFVDVAVFCIPP